MFSRVSLCSHEAISTSSRGLRIGVTQDQGAALCTPSLEIVDMSTTGRGMI
jgi:hypothetical protein